MAEHSHTDITSHSTDGFPTRTGEEFLELRTLTLTKLADDDAGQKRASIFDPIPRVEGIEPSDDPLLELRAAIYLISGPPSAQQYAD